MESRHALFQEFMPNAKVFSTGHNLLNHIRASGEMSVVHGYLINSYRFQTSNISTAFWKLQLSIIGQLRLIQSLAVIVIIVIPDHDGCSLRLFVQGLATSQWKVSSRDISFIKIGNSIAKLCTIITVVHLSSANIVEPLDLKTPQTVTPRPITAYIWEPFNCPEHSVGYAREDADFNNDESTKMVASDPIPADSVGPPHVVIKYTLHRTGDGTNILAGSSVLLTNDLCLPLEECPNQNFFQHLFGIEFHHNGHTYVRATSTFKFTCCFNLIKSIQYRLSHERHKHNLEALLPAKTSAWVFEQDLSHLIFVCNLNCEVMLPNQFAVLAATIQRLPSRERWISAYNNDDELCTVQELALTPSLI
jgi:hypothetical protein